MGFDNSLMASNSKQFHLIIVGGKNNYLRDPFGLFFLCGTTMFFFLCVFSVNLSVTYGVSFSKGSTIECR